MIDNEAIVILEKITYRLDSIQSLLAVVFGAIVLWCFWWLITR